MRILIYIFLFFCFFPYLDLLGLGTDTQPNAMILGLILLFAMDKKWLNAPIILLWVTAILGMLLIFKNSLGVMEYVRNVLNYLSPPIIALVAYNLCKKYQIRVPFKAFVLIVLTYLIVGLIQFYIWPSFLTGLVNGSARGILFGGRGVVSLCPEPAFYGSMCLFLMVFSLLCYSARHNWLTIPLLLFQLVFLSRSSTAIVILLAALVFFLVFQMLTFKFRIIVNTLIVILLLIPIGGFVSASLEKSRFGELLDSFIDNPFLIAQVDQSVGIRFMGVVSPFLSFRHANGIPQGIGNYKAFLQKLYRAGKYRMVLSKDIVNEKVKLGGSINLVLFQLGLIGLIFPLAIILSFIRAIRNSGVMLAFLIFFTLLFTQIQLMHSMIGLIIGFAIYVTSFYQDNKLSY